MKSCFQCGRARYRRPILDRKSRAFCSAYCRTRQEEREAIPPPVRVPFNPATNLSSSTERKLRLRAFDLKRKYGDSFYTSVEWQEARYRALLQSCGRCEACGRGKAETRLHVDHIKPRSRYPHLALEVTNLQVLCEDCNLGKGTHDETAWEKNLPSASQGGPGVPAERLQERLPFLTKGSKRP